MRTQTTYPANKRRSVQLALAIEALPSPCGEIVTDNSPNWSDSVSEVSFCELDHSDVDLVFFPVSVSRWQSESPVSRIHSSVPPKRPRRTNLSKTMTR